MQAKRDNQPVDSRRQWLTAVWRWGALTVLAALTARLAFRAPGATDCGRTSPCSRCGLLARCDLPRANRARRSRERSE